MLQLININFYHIISDEVKCKINNFIKNGETYIDEIEFPEYSRIMHINLINNKNEKTFIKLSFKKIRLPEENDDHPINELNKMQEDLFSPTE